MPMKYKKIIYLNTMKSAYHTASTSTEKQYRSNFEFDGANTLTAYNHEEGRLTPKTGGGYLLEYYLKDHLFSNRIVFADVNGNTTIEPATEILEENTYYPFGLEQSGLMNTIASNASTYQYSGKEMLDFNGYNMNDYGARYYDAALGRWNVIDPLVEKYHAFSPYNFVVNNPMKYVDPDGRGINGGFSVENQSTSTIKVWGSAATEQKNFYDYDYEERAPTLLVEGEQTPLEIEPGQRFEAKVINVGVGDDGRIEHKFTGQLVQFAELIDGKLVELDKPVVVKEDVNIWDVDYIEVQDNQTFVDGEKKYNTNESDKSSLTPNPPTGPGTIKLRSGFFDGEPSKEDANEGKAVISGNKDALKIKSKGDIENKPKIIYGTGIKHEN